MPLIGDNFIITIGNNTMIINELLLKSDTQLFWGTSQIQASSIKGLRLTAPTNELLLKSDSQLFWGRFTNPGFFY